MWVIMLYLSRACIVQCDWLACILIYDWLASIVGYDRLACIERYDWLANCKPGLKVIMSHNGAECKPHYDMNMCNEIGYMLHSYTGPHLQLLKELAKETQKLRQNPCRLCPWEW